MLDNKTSVSDILNSVTIYRDIFEEARDKAIFLEDACTKVTTHLTGMPSGVSDREALLARLSDAHDEQFEASAKMCDCIKLVRSFVEGSPLEEDEKKILIFRYVYNYPWKSIKEMLTGLSERQMYYVHSEAIKKLISYYETIEDKSIYEHIILDW